MRPDNSEYIGVDAGAAKVGIARGSAGARLAEPLASFPAKDAISKIAGLARDSGAAGIVVGLPRGLDGQETAQTRQTRQWAERLKVQTGLVCYFQDEAMTSRQAADRLQTSKSKNKKHDEHSLAAAVILQDFLDAPVDNRVKV